MTTSVRRAFRMIRGEGRTSPSAHRDLVVLEKKPVMAKQLTFACWANGVCNERLLSVGIDGLDFAAFRQLLIDTAARHIVDIRNLASFRGRGFSPDLVEATFREFGITYERSFELANRFVGTSSNQHVVLQQYATHLRQEGASTIDHLLNCVLAGPVVLLGRESAHFGTEREIVVELLAERHLPLEILVSKKRSTVNHAWGWTSLLLGKRAEDPKAPSRKKGHRAKKRQLVLPEIERGKK